MKGPEDDDAIDRVVVANPGSLRWMSPMASALAHAGLLRLYLTSIACTPAWDRRLSALPDALGRRLRRELALRPVPEGVGPGMVGVAATAAEVISVGALRLGLPESIVRATVRRRARAIDRATARRLRAGDRAVIVSMDAGASTLRRAKALGVRSFLDYPIAHHDFAQAILSEEARRVPEYAPTLQFARLRRSHRARLDEELGLADRIFVLSSFQRRTFVEAGIDPARLVLTPLGVDLEMFHPQPRPDDGTFAVLFAGQITQRKGISYLIDGFERAAMPGSELRLLGGIVGAAPWRRRSGVRHLPPVPIFELRRAYVACDAYVLPSLVEGFPQTALIAMACGLPVIVSENTFGADVITDGRDGYVIPIRDPDAIAERLRHLHANPEERRRIGAAARRRAEDFSWRRYGQRIVTAVRDSC